MAKTYAASVPKATSYKVAESLYLVALTVSAASAKPAAPAATHHVLVVDCSGSMYSDLPRIRTQIKTKVPSLIGETDTLSIIWFSGRGEFGTIVEGEPVRTMADLTKVWAAVDRGLQARGLTGFKDPIEEAAKLAGRLTKKTPGAISLIFLSDGCDNCSSHAEIMRAVDQAAGVVSTGAVVEYGYYADRQTLTTMATKMGVPLIFAESFDAYSPKFEAALSKRSANARKVTANLGCVPVGEFAYALSGGDLLTFGAVDNQAVVPEDIGDIFYLSTGPVGGLASDISTYAKGTSKGIGDLSKNLDAAYAAVSLYANRMQSTTVLALLRALGDVRFVDAYSRCFGKQLYSDFCAATTGAAFNAAIRYTQGYSANAVPKDDAFTILDLLSLLADDDQNRFLPDHTAWKYNRIGRGRVDASDQITATEADKIKALSESLTTEPTVEAAQAIKAEIDKILSGKGKPLVFVPDQAEEGYAISRLVLNHDRPNISVSIQRKGTVDMLDRVTPAAPIGLARVPGIFPTHQHRTYTIVGNGLVNVDTLPVLLTPKAWARLQAEGIIPAGAAYQRVPVLINLRALPIVNRQMVSAVSAESLARLEWDLTKAQATQKVYNSLAKEYAAKGTAKVDTGMVAVYGADAALWLGSLGFGENGYSPKHTTQTEATDVIRVRELGTKIAKFSAIPSLNDYREQAAKGKLTPSAALMTDAVKTYEAAVSLKPTDDAMTKWLEDKQAEATRVCRVLLEQIARIKFAIIVGQVWFKEFKSLDEKTITVKVDGQALEVTFELTEKDERI